MDVDPAQLEKAARRLHQLGGFSDEVAGELAEAIAAGTVDHAFDVINGSGPVPTSLNAMRANQLRWICERVGRLVSQREVEIIFRVTPGSARLILSTMLATYEESLREKFIARMRTDAAIEPSGSADAGLSWTLKFTEPGTYEAARSELSRLGLLRDVNENVAARRIVIPQRMSRDDSEVDPLALLGLERPVSE